jgi:hypothetical protein
MADETGLTWVDEPTIHDGNVVYKYRNTSDKDATFVKESLNLVPEGGGPNQVQLFQVDGLAVGAEQETHAPAGSDLPDGKATVLISVQSASGTERYDGLLEYELKGVVAGGVLRAEGDVAGASAGTLAVHVEDLRLDGAEVVLHYRVIGAFDQLSAGFTLFDPQGGAGWTQAMTLGIDREDIVRIAVPFDEVLGTEQGWAIEVSMAVGNSQTEIMTGVHARLPVERVDESVVAPSGWSVVPD